VSRLPSIKYLAPDITKALHDTLDGMDRKTIETRMEVQMHLVQVSSGLPLAKIEEENEMISTERAAAMMNCSRPYVAMLVDRKKLPGSVKTPGGHRKIPLSSVHAWIRENLPQQNTNSDYKVAAQDAGMYDVSEETYVKVLSRSHREVKSA
jgi:excisionase family DNA binding protein